MTFSTNVIFTTHANNNGKYIDLPEDIIFDPTIFFMHELPDDHNCNIAIYADDYTLYS